MVLNRNISHEKPSCSKIELLNNTVCVCVLQCVCVCVCVCVTMLNKEKTTKALFVTLTLIDINNLFHFMLSVADRCKRPNLALQETRCRYKNTTRTRGHTSGLATLAS